MIFTAPEFVVFFLLFFSIYATLRGRPRKLFLLGASYFFYGSWNAKFLLLIVGSTLLDFYVGRAIARNDEPRRRRRLLALSVCGNLGVLGFFKYFNFFSASAAELLSALGLSVSPLLLEMVLPVGISFYTFQTMSYTIDIYRGRLEPTESLLDFSMFVAFFPQLVAGPIERARHLLPQLAHLDRPAIAGGWTLLALGAFKKAVIADNIAPLVAATYSAPDLVYAPALWLGTYAFAIQIYCDFSGYSDIAVGLGRLMGIEVVQNFRSPYAAAGPRELWTRWHISLSSWLRDYLYVPLGGNRGRPWRTAGNLFATMLLGGLWHGAAWNFVLWGAYHGVLLMVFRSAPLQRTLEPLRRSRASRIASTVIRRLIFFHLVCLGWALFRAQSLADCLTLWRKLLDVRQWQIAAWLDQVAISGEGRFLAYWFAIIVALVLVQNIAASDSHRVARVVRRLPEPLRFLLPLMLFIAAAIFSPETPPPFIYFQF
jgi:D-alanyl-lipoteichoic acid acyltransferase DltB (MBOAT superfamily)